MQQRETSVGGQKDLLKAMLERVLETVKDLAFTGQAHDTNGFDLRGAGGRGWKL